MRISEATKKTVVIYPGRFHPFHKGHASVYNYLNNKYDSVYIATSNKIDPPKSPFSFAEKRAMMVFAGIPAGAIVQSTQPYRAEEILRNFDPATTSVVFAVSGKDMEEDPRFSFKPKKDGSPSYFQPMPKDPAAMVGFNTHGYITTVPTLDFTVLDKPMRSATELRQNFANADDETQKQMITDLYGAYDENIHNIMRNKIKEHVDEYAQYIVAAESVFADLNTLYEHKQFDITRVLEHANKIVDRINSIPVVETLDYLDPDDPMDSIVIIPGVGTMSVRGLMDNISAKMKELSMMSDTGEPTAFRNIKYRMDTNIIGVMMDALVNAFDDIENIRRKGGENSKSIPKDVFDSVMHMHEAWSAKYKRSIDCSNPKGFSQRAHCQGRNKKESIEETIRKQGNKYVIYSKDGKKKLGTYDSRKDAEKRLRQIEYFKHKTESIEEAESKQDMTLSHLHPSLRPMVRTALMKYPMADSELAAVVQMLKQEHERNRKQEKDLKRLDRENDEQDVEIDYTDARIDKLEKTKAESIEEAGVGIIDKQNTTQDVKPGETERQAKKFFGGDGKPKPLHRSAASNSTPNKLFNLGLAEIYTPLAIAIMEGGNSLPEFENINESIAQKLEAEFPGLDLDLYDTKAGYILSKIALPKEERGSGIGTEVMQRIVDMADQEGKMIALTPDSAFGGSKGRLIDFYKRFGFVANKGRNKTFDFRETMVRYPQTNEDINEAFDNPYPFDWSGNPNDHYEATAEIPTSDDDYDLLYIVIDRDRPGFFDISFLRNTSMKATGKGDEFRIFATVIEAIKQWWDDVDRDKVKEIVFSASKNPEDSSRRHVLYARFAKQFANQIGFDLEVLDRIGNVRFKLSSKDDHGFNEDISMPDWQTIVAIAAAARMTPLAIKAMWKTAKGAYAVKKFADRAGIKIADKIKEAWQLRLERDDDMDVLHITDTRTGKRTEVRGKKDYEGDGYDAEDKLHQLLDKVGKAASISDLMNGEPVTINPTHPQGPSAKAHAKKAFNEAVMKISDLTVSDAGMAIAQSAGGGSKTDAPIAVTKLPSGHVYVANGYHRLVDAMNAGKDSVEVEYLPFEKVEILWKNEREEDIKYGKQFNEADGQTAQGASAKTHAEKAFNEGFIEPQFDVEWEEAERYPEFEKIGKEEWIELASKGKAVEITDASDIENTDAADPDSFKSLDPNKQKRALAQLEKGDVEMPIVAVYSDGYKELIGGNTRLTAMMAKDGKATVWQFEVPDEVAELAKEDLNTSEREFAVERGGIVVPFASGNFASIVPHRALKVKKPTPGRLSYEQPKDNRKRNN